MSDDHLTGRLGLQFLRQFGAEVLRTCQKHPTNKRSDGSRLTRVMPDGELHLTLFLRDGPHHEVHAGGVGLTAQFERVQLAVEILDVMQDPLKLRLTAAELLQNKIMNLFHKRRL